MNANHSSNRRPTRRERHSGLQRSLSSLAGMFQEHEQTISSPQHFIGDISSPADSMLQVIGEANGYPSIADECQDHEDSDRCFITCSMMYRRNQQEIEEQELVLQPSTSCILVPRTATSLPPSSTLLRTMSFDEEDNERASVVAKRNLSISSDDSFFLELIDDDDHDDEYKSICYGQEKYY